MGQAVQSSTHPCEIKCLVTRESPAGRAQTPGKVERRMVAAPSGQMATLIAAWLTDTRPVTWQRVRA